jgi:hypothetical protein
MGDWKVGFGHWSSMDSGESEKVETEITCSFKMSWDQRHRMKRTFEVVNVAQRRSRVML